MNQVKLIWMMYCTIMGIIIGITIGKMMYHTESIPINWDYAIDLQQDSIKVFTDHGRLINVEHDGLDEFVAKDNL